MAVMLLLLAAVDEGLGALFFGMFEPTRPLVEAAFGVPPAHRGRSAPSPSATPAAPTEPGRSAGRPRRPLDEVVHRGRW